MRIFEVDMNWWAWTPKKYIFIKCQVYIMHKIIAWHVGFLQVPPKNMLVNYPQV